MSFVVSFYLCKRILKTVFSVTVVMLLIIMSGRFINYLASAVSGKLQADLLFQLIFWRIPEFLTMLLPFGLSIGIVWSYGRLHADNEMVIFRSIGIGRLKLLLITMIPGAFIAIIVGYLSLYFVPLSVNKIASIYADQKNKTGFESLISGRFQVFDKGNKVIYVESSEDNSGKWHNVFVVNHNKDLKNGELTLLLANSGEIITNEKGERYIVFYDGGRYEIKASGDPYLRKTHYKVYGIHYDKKSIKEESVVDSAMLSTEKLMGSKELSNIGELHWRLSMPLMVLVIVLLSIILSGLDSKRSAYSGLLPAVFVYLIYLMVLMMIKGQVEEGFFPAYPGIWLIHCIFIIFGSLAYAYIPLKLFFRKRREKRENS